MSALRRRLFAKIQEKGKNLSQRGKTYEVLWDEEGCDWWKAGAGTHHWRNLKTARDKTSRDQKRSNNGIYQLG